MCYLLHMHIQWRFSKIWNWDILDSLWHFSTSTRRPKYATNCPFNRWSWPTSSWTPFSSSFFISNLEDIIRFVVRSRCIKPEQLHLQSLFVLLYMCLCMYIWMCWWICMYSYITQAKTIKIYNIFLKINLQNIEVKISFRLARFIIIILTKLAKRTNFK